MVRLVVAALAAVGLVLSIVSGSSADTAARADHVKSVATLFAETPFAGGQVPPRLYKWVNQDTSIFVQLDRSNPAEATGVRYIGIGTKGTFCAEAQPGGPSGGFTHYHRVTAPAYAQGHGGAAGESNGYWLLWVATDTFETGDRRKVTPGVDYQFSPTPPPACGANVPKPEFAAPNAHDLTRAEIKRLVHFFNDNPFKGGQTPPRFYRWLSADVLAYLEFDNPNPEKAKELRYFGVARRGIFCRATQPTADFTSFQRLTAKTWRAGKGGKPRQGGFWHLALAVDDFRMPWGNVVRGVDRKFAVTPAPECPGTSGGPETPGASPGGTPGGPIGGSGPEVKLVAQTGNASKPFAFAPEALTVPVGTTVRWINDAEVFHTVTSTAQTGPLTPSGLFNGSVFQRGATFEFRFTQRGTYRYYCQPHSTFMTGTVTVTG